MKDIINSIDMNEKLDHEEIYSLFKTHLPKINEQISDRIDIFKKNKDFFEFYSNKDIKKLLYIFELKQPENKDESFTLLKSDIEQYILCISQIILSIKLFLKTHNILTKIVINAKNQLSKLKKESKLENYNHDSLFTYLDSLLKNSEEDYKISSSLSTLLSSNASSFENTSKNSLLPKFSNECKIDSLSNIEIESNTYDSPPTPRFESESDEDFKNHEEKISILENSMGYIYPTKKNSVLSLHDYVFAEESLIQQNVESELIESSIVKPRKKRNISTKGKLPQIENFNKQEKKRNMKSETSLFKNNNKKYYRNLLEMINRIYKKGIINSEEKVKLKQLVIEKSNKIEHFYYNVYINSKDDKNTLVTEIKKILN